MCPPIAKHILNHETSECEIFLKTRSRNSSVEKCDNRPIMRKVVFRPPFVFLFQPVIASKICMQDLSVEPKYDTTDSWPHESLIH